MLEDIEFDLRAVVEEVGEMMSFRAHSKALELITYIPHDLPTRLVGDATRLRQVSLLFLSCVPNGSILKLFTQVLINLVSNGVKFTEKGQVVIHAGLVSCTELHAVLRFEVRDTGIGISKTLMSQLFEPWTQANQSTFRKYGGSGLGLAISKQLVELFEGGIHIQSEEGKGSSFIFTAKFKRQPLRPSTSKTAVTRDMIRQVRGTRCLVIESNPMSAAAIREVLLSLECNVKIVSSCQDATRLLTSEAQSQNQASTEGSTSSLGGQEIIFLDSLRLIKERNEMAALLANYSSKYFVLMTRITERGVLRINASNFSSVAKPIKRIPLLDCLIAYKEKVKKTSSPLSSPKVPQLRRTPSEEEAQEQPTTAALTEMAQKLDLYTDSGTAAPAPTPPRQHAAPSEDKPCEGPITVNRILQSMQSPPEAFPSENSIREIDGASFLMAEVLQSA